MKLYINKNRIKLFLNNNPIIAKLYFNKYSNLLYDETTLPFISIYYYNPKPYNDEDVIIPFYFTDFYQREYYYNDTSLKFTLRYELDGDVKYKYNLTSGDHEVNFGKLSEGVHWYSLQVIDEQGRESRRIFNDLWVVDRLSYPITEEQIYNITDSDLTTYSINKSNSEIEQDLINNRLGLSRLFLNIHNQGYRKCILPTGIYRINRADRDVADYSENSPIIIPTNLTVDLNGSTIKLHPYDDREYGERGHVPNTMVRMTDCIDSHLINGTIEGDFAERKELIWAEDGSNAVSGSNGEHSSGFYCCGGEFCSLENMVFKQITGYNVCASQSGSYGDSGIGEWVDNLDVVNGIDTVKEGYVTSTISQLSDNMIQHKYIVASVWLAMGYLKGKYWDMKFHFYDENQTFIESITTYQFTRCRIPENSKYFRITFRATSNDIGSLNVHHMKVTRYFTIKDCEWIDNRTCAAPSQCQFYIYDNCKFTRSGQSGPGITITPCEIDLEDGWEQMQDIFVRGCEIIEPSGFGGIIDNAGINHVFENNINFNHVLRYRLTGITVRNCIGGSVGLSLGFMTRNTVRVYNNSDLVGIKSGVVDNNFFDKEKIKVKYKDNSLKLGYTNWFKDYYVLDSSNVDICDIITRCHFTNSTIRIAGGWEKAYIGGSLLMENCNFNLYDNADKILFSFDELNSGNKFINCVYNGNVEFLDHNNFNSGEWTNCTFNNNVLINPKHSNIIGDIQFNNCKFKGIVTIKPQVSDCYIQFNNCTFEQTPVFQYYGESNSEFNNCILPN